MCYSSLYIKETCVKIQHKTIAIYKFLSQIDNYKYVTKYILKIYSCVNNTTRNTYERSATCITNADKEKFWRLKSPLKYKRKKKHFYA